MKIVISGSDITHAVSQVSKTTGAKHVSFSAKDDTLIVSGSEKGRTLIITMAAEVKEEGGFTALPEVLIGVCSNRKQVTLNQSDDESQVVVTSGKYAADITILPYEEITLQEPAGIELGMGEAELRVLLDVCSRAQLTAPYIEGTPSLPLHVKITDKGTHVASLDSLHVASVRTRQVTKAEDMELVLPAGVLSTVASAASGDNYRIVLSESVVYANNSKFQLCLPVEQPESNNLGFKHVAIMQNMIKKEENVTTVSIDFPDLDAILSNVYAVAEAGVPITFTVKKSTLTVGTSTNYGSASDTLDAEVNGATGEFKFNPSLVSEIFNKIRADKVELNFLPKMMFITQRTGETTSLFIVVRASS